MIDLQRQVIWNPKRSPLEFLMYLYYVLLHKNKKPPFWDGLKAF